MSTELYHFPPVSELPEHDGLRDPFIGPDGRRVQSIDEWPAQREYLKALAAHYMHGRMPPHPTADEVTIRQVFSREAFEGKAVEERHVLTIERNGRSCDLDIWLFRPQEDRRYLTVIKNCHRLFDIDTPYRPATDEAARLSREAIDRDLAAARDAVGRGYVLCKFLREQFSPDSGYKAHLESQGVPTSDQHELGVHPLYPGYDWGAICTWAWGHGVVLDALDRIGCTDPERTVATGHSRGGQASIAAGVYDERIAVVVPCTGGYGSCGTLRVRDPEGARGKVDMIEILQTNAPHFYTPRYHEFVGRQNKLPFDAHTLVSLIAPRPFLNTNATEDPYNNTLAIEAGIRAGGRVYEWMGREEWCRLHWRPGTHAQKVEDWTALLDYADEVFFGRKGASLYNQWIYPDASQTLDWQEPDA